MWMFYLDVYVTSYDYQLDSFMAHSNNVLWIVFYGNINAYNLWYANAMLLAFQQMQLIRSSSDVTVMSFFTIRNMYDVCMRWCMWHIYLFWVCAMKVHFVDSFTELMDRAFMLCL